MTAIDDVIILRIRTYYQTIQLILQLSTNRFVQFRFLKKFFNLPFLKIKQVWKAFTELSFVERLLELFELLQQERRHKFVR